MLILWPLSSVSLTYTGSSHSTCWISCPFSIAYVYHRTSPCLGICETVHNMAVFMVFCTSPNPQAGEPPFVSCLWLLIQYSHSYPPHWQPFLHLQPQDMPCPSDRDPTTKGQIITIFPGKMYLSISKTPRPQIKCLLRKNILRRQSVKKQNFWNSETVSAHSTLMIVVLCSGDFKLYSNTCSITPRQLVIEVRALEGVYV